MVMVCVAQRCDSRDSQKWFTFKAEPKKFADSIGNRKRKEPKIVYIKVYELRN